MRRICERQNLKAQCATDAKHLDFGVIISQIRNARELVHLRRICEQQNLKAQRATDANHLDFGVIISYIRACFLHIMEFL